MVHHGVDISEVMCAEYSPVPSSLFSMKNRQNLSENWGIALDLSSKKSHTCCTSPDTEGNSSSHMPKKYLHWGYDNVSTQTWVTI